MNAKIIFILFACLWYVDGCDKSSNSNCSGSAQCNHHRHERETMNKPATENKERTLIQLNGSQYSVKLPQDPCSFNTYDTDRNGIISQGELFGVLGIDMIPTSVVKDLDAMTDEKAITAEEFYAKISLIVPEC